jgi:hypothetical protein
MKTLFKPHLKEALDKLKKYNSLKKDDNFDNNNKYKQKKEEYIKNKEDKKIKKEINNK